MPRATDKYLREYVDQMKSEGQNVALKFMNGRVALVEPVNDKGGYRQITHFMANGELAAWLDAYQRGRASASQNPPYEPGWDNIKTAAGKRHFLREFLNSVRDVLVSKADKIPETWDGHELRWLVADTLAREQHHRTGEFRLPHGTDAGWRKRVREYRNETITRSL